MTCETSSWFKPWRKATRGSNFSPPPKNAKPPPPRAHPSGKKSALRGKTPSSRVGRSTSSVACAPAIRRPRRGSSNRLQRRTCIHLIEEAILSDRQHLTAQMLHAIQNRSMLSCGRVHRQTRSHNRQINRFCRAGGKDNAPAGRQQSRHLITGDLNRCGRCSACGMYAVRVRKSAL